MTKTKEKFLVNFRNELYDITSFIHKHPGGVNTLRGLENTDMTKRFMNAPPHSDAAIYLMKEYRVNKIDPSSLKNGCIKSSKTMCSGANNNNDNDIANTNHILCNGTGSLNGSLCNGINGNSNGFLNGGHNHYKTEPNDEKNQNQNQNQNQIQKQIGANQICIDESMEHLVDWSKAMLPQIPKIADYYEEWVNKPVDRPLRLFTPWYIELCTKTPWYAVPSFWVPVIIYLIGTQFLYNNMITTNDKLIRLIGGVFAWTLIEYILHRWLFHMKNINGNKWLCTLHFTLHGLHHKVPFDPYRLVFPPLPAVLLASVIYMPISLVFPHSRLILAGGLSGYLSYDLIHYYLHYGNPTNMFLYHMKRYHYQHHFVYHEIGFGISSPIWDYVFNTRIYLRKLKYMLRW